MTSTTAAKPAGKCWRCGGQLYENLAHACTTSVAPHAVTAPSTEAAYEHLLAVVAFELEEALSRFPAFNSAHEGYAVIAEELDELWDAVKANDTDHARKEAVQVAAMAVRFLVDVPARGGAS